MRQGTCNDNAEVSTRENLDLLNYVLDVDLKVDTQQGTRRRSMQCWIHSLQVNLKVTDALRSRVALAEVASSHL